MARGVSYERVGPAPSVIHFTAVGASIRVVSIGDLSCRVS
jgi:hypothetical protein